MKKNVPVMAKIIKILPVILLLLTSCYTQKTANRQVVKAYSEYPAVVDRLCGLWNDPVVMTRDSFIYKPGRPILLPGKTDTIEVDCDSVLAATTLGQRAKAKVPCPAPDTVLRIDSFYRSRENTEVNRSRERALEAEVKECDIAYARLHKAFNIAMWCAIILGVYTLGRWILRIWKIKLP